MAESLKTRIILRNDTLANWQSANPVVSNGEAAVVYDGSRVRVKFGDGIKQFNDLAYLADYDTDIANLNTLINNLTADVAKKVDRVANLASGAKSYVTNNVGDAGATLKLESSSNWAAVAVNDGGSGIAAQIYDWKMNGSTYEKGTVIDVTEDKIYYYKGNYTAAVNRDVAGNEIAVISDINTVKTELQANIDAEATARSTKDTELETRIENLEARGRFLSAWNAVTGKPTTEPSSLPYTYKSGDYYIVGTVAVAPASNYKPTGSNYTGAASTAVESKEVGIGDYYTYDGTNWILVQNSQKTVTFEQLAGVPRDNLALKAEIEALESADATEAATRKAKDDALDARIDTEAATRAVEDAKKVDKEIVSDGNKALIFNEADGGGAKFEHSDGTESFVGVNNGGESGIAAQIYADKLVDGKWQGAKIDVKNTGIYYTVGNKSAAERDVAANEIAVKGDVSAEATARATADTTLGTRISVEETTRATADQRLSDAITEEAAIRDETDAALLDKIGAEKSRAQTAEATLQTNITNEATRAKAEEAKKLEKYTVTVNGKEGQYVGDANVPVYFDADVAADKITVNSYAITLDTNKEQVASKHSLDIPAATTATAGLMSAADKVALAGKQDQLTAGTGIDITNNVIKLNLTEVILDGGTANG